jgi:hypothetical protein
MLLQLLQRGGEFSGAWQSIAVCHQPTAQHSQLDEQAPVG